MAYVVEIIGNICYAQGKYLRYGERYDTGDTALDAQIVEAIEEQMATGRTVRVLRTYDPKPEVAEETPVKAVSDENTTVEEPVVTKRRKLNTK